MHATVPFIAVIPARLASTRLPNKPLADIGGKPMVVRVAERARASGASRVLVATDAPSVLEASQAHGFDALMTRADHPSGTDRLAEAVDQCGLPDDALVVNVQGDEPLIEPKLIASIAAHLAANPECAAATAAHPLTNLTEVFNPNVVKTVLDAAGNALYFSRAPIPWSRDTYPPHGLAPGATQTIEPAALPASMNAVYRHIGIYAYHARFLRHYPTLSQAPLETIEGLEQLRMLWHSKRIAVLVTQHIPVAGVDTPADLERVREIFAHRA